MSGTFTRGAILALVALSLGSFAFPAPARADELILHVYDVSDLLRPIPDFPAPRLGLSGLEDAPLAPEPERTAWTMEELVDLIRQALGDEIAASGGTVTALGSNLVVSLPAAAQTRVAELLREPRESAGEAYTIEARWVELSEEAIAELGLPAAARPRAIRFDAGAGERLLAAIAARDDVAALTAPRLTVFANQRSHIVLLNQEAYVDRFEIDDKGIADPVIVAMNTGLTLETTVRPRRDREGIILYWEAQVARALLPEPAEPAPDLALEPELGVPEVTTVVREGRTALAPGELVVVRGLPSTESERPTLLVIGWREGEPESKEER